MKKTTVVTETVTVETVTVTEKVCKVCGKTHPIENFRVHKSGYSLNKCKDCEKAAWNIRSAEKRNAKKSVTPFFSVTTKTGTYEVSSTPIVGGRKVVSTETDKVLYVPETVTRDQARSIFQVYAGVSRTGISASKVG